MRAQRDAMHSRARMSTRTGWCTSASRWDQVWPSRLAAEVPPRALILRSPFTSFVDVGRFHYPYLPVAWLLRDRYASIDRIAQVKSSVLVVAGSNDTIVPASLSRRLFDAAREPKRLLVIDGADHNDEVLIAGPQVIEAVSAFLSPL